MTKHLDLDDVAATSPAAQKELAELRAKCAEAEQAIAYCLDYEKLYTAERGRADALQRVIDEARGQEPYGFLVLDRERNTEDFVRGLPSDDEDMQGVDAIPVYVRAPVPAQPSAVADICNAYESGVGHRGRKTAKINPYQPGTPEHEAYAIGAEGEQPSAPVAQPITSSDGQAGFRSERELAEHEYTISAFDYERAPVGSRDWTLFWSGWQKRASVAQPAPASAEGCDPAFMAALERGDHLKDIPEGVRNRALAIARQFPFTGEQPAPAVADGMRLIVDAADLEVGRWYWTRWRDGGTVRMQHVFAHMDDPTKKYVGEGRLWAYPGNDQFTGYLVAVGPVPKAEFDAMLAASAPKEST